MDLKDLTSVFASHQPKDTMGSLTHQTEEFHKHLASHSPSRATLQSCENLSSSSAQFM